MCSECDKSQLVFSKKKPPTKILIKFKKQTADPLFTCGTMVLELDGDKKEIIEHSEMRENLINCQMSVEKLYFSTAYKPYRCHCLKKRKLVYNSNYYPFCTLCKHMSKEPILKTKVTKKREYKLFVFAVVFKKGQHICFAIVLKRKQQNKQTNTKKT